MNNNVSQAFDEVIERLSTKQRIRNGLTLCGSSNTKKFRCLRNDLSRFCKEVCGIEFSQLTFDTIDNSFLQKFADHLIMQGKKAGNNGNATDKLFRLKHVFKSAGIRTEAFNSVNFGTSTEKKFRKELGHGDIMRIMLVDRSLFSDKELLHNIDLFLFSYFTGGSTIMEMAELKRSDLQDEILSCTRISSSITARIPIDDPAKAILERYRAHCFEDYRLPILTAKSKNAVQQLGRTKRMAEQINKTLHKVRAILGLQYEITLNMTRRAYIERMLFCGHPLDLITLSVGCSYETLLRYYKE